MIIIVDEFLDICVIFMWLCDSCYCSCYSLSRVAYGVCVWLFCRLEVVAPNSDLVLMASTIPGDSFSCSIVPPYNIMF